MSNVGVHRVRKYMCSLIIILYGIEGCIWCKLEKVALEEHGITYTYREITPEIGAKGVPYMVNTDKGTSHEGYITGKELTEFAA